MHIDGRLSDALNRREAIAIGDVSWAPIDGSEPFTPAPGLKSVDPYDLIVVLAGEATLPPLSEAEKAAHKVHKVPYDVALEAPPFRVFGTVYLFPGSEPERLLDRATEMFVPVIDAHAYLGEERIGGPEVESSSSTASTCAASSRSTGGLARRPRACPGDRPGPVPWSGRRAGTARARPSSARTARVPRSRSARASKSSVTFSFGNSSTTARPSLAARTKSSPPDRMRARAGIPTVRSMSATETPLLARLTTIASVPDAELGGEVAQLDGGPERRHVRGDRDEDPVGALEDGLVDGP